jgi:hypothetical protein
MLLALLALALPTAALANSIDFDTGKFVSGTITGSFTNPFHVTVVGSINVISLVDATVTGACGATVSTCDFTGGTITVANGSGTIFVDSLSGGTISKLSRNTNIITATLLPSTTVTSGTVVFLTTTLDDNTLSAGSASVVATVVPEPSALVSFGTGLVGLAGMMRRKLKRGTEVRIWISGFKWSNPWWAVHSFISTPIREEPFKQRPAAADY